MAGHLASTAIAVAVLTVMGTGLWARATAMAATLAFMMTTDCFHPPGGECGGQGRGVQGAAGARGNDRQGQRRTMHHTPATKGWPIWMRLD